MLPLALSVLCETTAWRRMRAHLIAPLAATLLALSACGDGGGVIGGGGDDDDNPPPAACTADTCGEVRIALTDADGDFISYAVDVVSIELERANGATVQTLPNRQRVDFAELVDVAEFVTAAQVPNGTYVSATIRLDYSDAEVSVEVAGAPTTAVVVDANGAALGVVDLELQLDDANHVVIAPGTPALLQLDFDLAATHEVNILTTPVSALADPVLVAEIVPVDAREFRVRGPLVSVDEAAGSYIVDLRPFNHPTAEHGDFTVLTTTTTTFEVNGDELTGAAGLAAMADLGANTPTVAQGVYDVAEREFTANKVLAGSSVPGADLDVVIGNVIARNGNDAEGARRHRCPAGRPRGLRAPRHHGADRPGHGRDEVRRRRQRRSTSTRSPSASASMRSARRAAMSAPRSRTSCSTRRRAACGCTGRTSPARSSIRTRAR